MRRKLTSQKSNLPPLSVDAILTLKTAIQEKHEEFRRIGSETMLAIGQMLLLLAANVQEGELISFYEASGIEARTAQHYMRAANQFDVGDEIISYVSPTALYALSANRVTEEMRQRVLDQAKERPLRLADVKAILKDAATEIKTTSKPDSNSRDVDTKQVSTDAFAKLLDHWIDLELALDEVITIHAPLSGLTFDEFLAFLRSRQKPRLLPASTNHNLSEEG